MDQKLRQLQLVELEILNEFVRICDEYKLQYFLVGGTLLGAVRHQGFIPWDDDIDVAMPRQDYDSFAEICAKELKRQYFYQSADTDPNYFLSYAKLRKNGTLFYEERFKNSRFHKGIFIDIIPLDSCPKPGLACHFFFNVLAVMNYRGQVDSGETYEPYKELSGKVGYLVLRLFSKEALVFGRKYLIRFLRCFKDSKFIASYSGAYGYAKEVFPIEWFSEGTPVLFEGKYYSAPTKIKEQLTQVYGEDFMALPDSSKQRIHCDIEKCKIN